MKNYETQTIIKEVVGSITCNKCGRTERVIGEKADRSYISNLFHSFDALFDYGSSHDEEKWSFDLCEDCLLDFVKSFKHAPNVSNY